VRLKWIAVNILRLWEAALDEAVDGESAFAGDDDGDVQRAMRETFGRSSLKTDDCGVEQRLGS
jgi:hypothetical protein